jgi:hypothetical protein
MLMKKTSQERKKRREREGAREGRRGRVNVIHQF